MRTRLLIGVAFISLLAAQDPCSSVRWELEFYQRYAYILAFTQTAGVIDQVRQNLEPPHVDENIIAETSSGLALACKGVPCRPVYTMPEYEGTVGWIRDIVRAFADAKNAIPQTLRDKVPEHLKELSGDVGTAAKLLHLLAMQERYQRGDSYSAYNRGIRKLCRLRPDAVYTDLSGSSTHSCVTQAPSHQ